MPRLQPKRKAWDNVRGQRGDNPRGSGRGFGVGSRAAARRGGGGLAAHVDLLHNREQPCCQELARYCKQVLEVIEPAVERGKALAVPPSSFSAIPTLAMLVATFLAETVREMKDPGTPTPSSHRSEIQAMVSSELSSSAKKKRKKKKKKTSDSDDQRGRGVAPEDEGAANLPSPASRGAGTEDPREEGVGDDEQNGKVPGVDGDAKLHTVDGASNGTTLASANATSATATIARCSTSQTLQPIVVACPAGNSSHSTQQQTQQSQPPTLFDLMVQDFFDNSKMVKTLLEGAAIPYSHDEFWNRITERSGTFQIRMESVKDMTSQIACHKCRRCVEEVLEGEARLYVTRAAKGGVGRNHCVPFFSEESYIQMEEGQYDDQIAAWQRDQERDLSFQLAVSNEDEDEMVWQLRGLGLGESALDEEDGDSGLGMSGDKNGGASEVTVKCPTENDWRRGVLYDFLLGRGIVACDLAPFRRGVQAREDHTDLDGATARQPALDSGVVHAMTQYASTKVDTYEKEITGCERKMKQAKEELVAHQQRDHYRSCENNIDMTAFQVLDNADKEACGAIACYLTILTELTLSLFMAATTANEDAAPAWRQRDWDELHCLITAMWDVWLLSVQEVVSSIAQYEMGLRKLTNRNGRFPQAFSSSKYRELYHELVWAKLNVGDKLLEKMRELLDTPVEAPGLHPQDHKTTVRRKIICYRIFCQHFVGLDYRVSPPVRPLDQRMQSVLEAIRECVETPHKASWDQVQQEHESRRQRLSRRCERVFSGSDLGRIVDVVRGHLTGSATVLNKDLVISSANDDAEARLSIASRYRDYLKEIGIQMVAGWLRERCHQSSVDTAIIIPSMPVELLLNIGHPMDGFNCFANAKTRAVCILLILFYRWVSDQCDEWRAELAEQELLTSMSGFDADHASADGGAPTSGKPKSSKKKKKKRGDSQTPPVKLDDNSQDPAKETIGRSMMSPESALDHFASPQSSGSAKDDTRFPTIGIQLNDEGELDTPVYEQMRDDYRGDRRDTQSDPLIDSNPPNLDVRNNVGVVPEPSFTSEPETVLSSLQDNLLQVESLLTIGVHDDLEFVSAEDFLVGRLMAVLMEPSSSQ